jgi:hypothetical protein
MTPQEHNKYVGLAQVGYAGFHLLMMIGRMGLEGYMFRNIYSRSQEMGGLPLPRIVWLIFGFGGVFSLAMSIPPVIAGYALLRRRPWAMVAGIVGGVVAAPSFPIGTGIAVYTFWFLFGDAGKEVYDVKKRELPPLPPSGRQASDSSSVDDGWVSYTPPPDPR